MTRVMEIVSQIQLNRTVIGSYYLSLNLFKKHMLNSVSIQQCAFRLKFDNGVLFFDNIWPGWKIKKNKLYIQDGHR